MYKDTRLFGTEKWYHTAPEDANMRIPDAILDCVCFICVKLAQGQDAESYKPIGTGFFVGINEFGYQFRYVVTAQHVIDEARRGKYVKIYLRVNTRDGKVDYIEVDMKPELWHSFTDPGVDLTAIHIPIPSNKFLFEVLPVEMFATDDCLSQYSIGPGDELFVTGLFRFRSGQNRNLPIIRTGIIAAMPEEMITDNKTGNRFAVYLAEMRSIAGLSGSPVFVFLNKYRLPDPKLENDADYAIFLLGIIRGHWGLSSQEALKKGETLDVESFDVEIGFSKGENMNLGIALVTPAHFLWGLLMNNKVKGMREGLARKLDALDEGVIVDDAVGLDSDVITEGDFNKVLQKASRKISLPAKETKETSE